MGDEATARACRRQRLESLSRALPANGDRPSAQIGTGRARGASIFGPPSAAALVREALAPFRDLGVVGAVSTKSRNVAGTDSTSFNNAGLPGIGFSQDPIEYNTHTHHTSLDNYERIIEDDVKASAMSIAATLYELAMRDDMVPRFSAADMPPPVPARTGSH